MNRILFSTTVGLVAVAPFAIQAADFPENPNRLTLGARFGMNFKGAFGNRGAVNAGPAIPGADHNYNDGYVRVDSSGNAGGLTWNWGYLNASQVVGDNMQFHAIESASPSGSAGGKANGD